MRGCVRVSVPEMGFFNFFLERGVPRWASADPGLYLQGVPTYLPEREIERERDREKRKEREIEREKEERQRDREAEIKKLSGWRWYRHQPKSADRRHSRLFNPAPDLPWF